MNADGTARRLTRTAAAEAEPAFSPDGRRIAFARSGAIHLIDAAGGPSRRVGAGSAAVLTRRAPAGAARRPGIALVELQDGNRRRLVRDRSAGAPAFSPEGTRAVDESDGGLRTIAAAGGGGTRLTRPPGLHHDPAPTRAATATLTSG